MHGTVIQLVRLIDLPCYLCAYENTVIAWSITNIFSIYSEIIKTLNEKAIFN